MRRIIPKPCCIRWGLNSSPCGNNNEIISTTILFCAVVAMRHSGGQHHFIPRSALPSHLVRNPKPLAQALHLG